MFTQEMIVLAMSHLRPNCSAKATKKLSKTIPEQYLGIALQTESKLNAWRLKVVAELRNFCTEPR